MDECSESNQSGGSFKTTLPFLDQYGPESLILLEEEYGYKKWFWFLDRPLSDILTWWRYAPFPSQWIFYPELLPGHVVSADNFKTLWIERFERPEFYIGHFGDETESFIKSPTGEILIPVSWIQTGVEFDNEMWTGLGNSSGRYSGLKPNGMMCEWNTWNT